MYVPMNVMKVTIKSNQTKIDKENAATIQIQQNEYDEINTSLDLLKGDSQVHQLKD